MQALCYPSFLSAHHPNYLYTVCHMFEVKGIRNKLAELSYTQSFVDWYKSQIEIVNVYSSVFNQALFRLLLLSSHIALMRTNVIQL